MKQTNFRKNASDICHIALAPFRYLAKGYLLVDDIIWRGYDLITRKIENKTGLNRTRLNGIMFQGVGIGFLSIFMMEDGTPIRLMGAQGFALFGFSVIFDSNDNQNSTVALSPIKYLARTFRLAALGIAAKFVIAPEVNTDAVVGTIGLFTASIHYINDSEGNGMLQHIKELARASVIFTRSTEITAR